MFVALLVIASALALGAVVDAVSVFLARRRAHARFLARVRMYAPDSYAVRLDDARARSARDARANGARAADLLITAVRRLEDGARFGSVSGAIGGARGYLAMADVDAREWRATVARIRAYSGDAQ